MNPNLHAQLFGSLGIESAEVVELEEATNVTEEDLPEEDIEEESTSAEAIEDVDTDVEISDMETQGENLENVEEGLEELDVAVEGLRSSGKNLLPIEAAALNLTIRQVVSKFVKDTGDLIPATESFNDDPERNTVLAQEGLKDAAKSFAEGTSAAIKKVIARIKEIIDDIINRFRGFEARANKVIVAAKAAKGKAAGKVEFKKDNISVNGSASAADLREGLERFKASLTKLKDVKTSEAAVQAITELANGGDGKSEIKYTEIFAQTRSYMEKSFNDIFGEGVKKDGAMVSKPFPGEWTPKLVMPEGADALYYDSLERVKPEEKGGKTELDALQPNEIIELAGLVKVVQATLKDFKGFSARQEAANKRFAAVAAPLGRDVEDVKSGREGLGTNAVKITAKIYNTIRLEMIFYSKMISAANQASGSVLELCEKSVKLISEGNAQEAKPEGEGQSGVAGNLPAPKEGE